MKKRILALVLCVLMVLALFPMSVFAEDKYEIANGDFWNGDQKVSVNELIQAETDISVVSHNEEGENTCVVVMLDGKAYYEPVVSDEITVEFPATVCYGGVSVKPDGDRTEYVHAFKTFIEEKAVEEIENTAVLGEESAPEETEKEPEELIENEAELLPAEETPAEEDLIENEAELLSEEKTPANEDLIENEAELLPEEVPEELPEEEISEEIVENEEKTGEPTLEEEVGEKAEEEPEMLFAAAPLGTPAPETYTVTYVPFSFEDGEFGPYPTKGNKLPDPLPDGKKLAGEKGKLYAEFVGWYYYEEKGTGFTLPTASKIGEKDAAKLAADFKAGEAQSVYVKATPGMELDEDVILYGEWEYKVTFDANGGKGKMDPVVKSFSEDYPAPECKFEAPKDMVFSCWEISIDDPADDYTEEIDPGDYATAIYGTWYGNITLKALWESKNISKVSAEMVTPLAGAKPCFTPVSYHSEPDGAIKNVTAEWFCGDNKLTAESVFEAGKTYTAKLTMEADEAHKVSGKVSTDLTNGKVEKKPGEKALLSLTYAVPAEEPSSAWGLDAVIQTPLIGDKPSETVEFDYYTYDKDGKLDPQGYPLTPKAYDIEWYEINGEKWYYMLAPTFEAGKTYGLKVKVETDGTLVFAEDTLAYINVNDTDYLFDPADISKATLSTTWTMPSVAPTRLKKVVVTIPTPAAGKHPTDYTATTVTAGAKLSDSILWQCGDDHLKDSDAFEAGKTYTASVMVYLREGYVFDPTVYAVVNGQNETGVYEKSVPDAICLTFTYTIPDPNKISKLDAFVDAPKVGEKPDLIAKYKTLPEGGVASYGDVVWYVSYTGSNKPKDWTRMKKGSSFKADRYYLAAFNVEAKKDGLPFLADLDVKVNGKEVDADDIIVDTEKGTAYFEYIWYIEEVKETKISHVEAKIDSPVVGERPDYTASFLSTPKNALDAYEVTWYIYDAKHGDWDKMSSKETFKKGETYGVKIEVYADDEYIFKKSVTGSINGFEHDERFCDIYDSHYPYEIVLFHSWKNISDKYTVTGTEDWYKGSKESLSFRSSASFKKFKSVKMDGVVIAEKNYTAESGSTIVTLKPAYLETLALGYHTVTIVSTDGEVSMEFEVHGDQKLKCKHSVSKLSGMKEATCTEKGYTGDRICKSCGAILEKGKVIPAAGHHYVNGTCTECGMRKDREKNPDTGASVASLAVAAVLAGAAATLAYKKRK